MGPQHNALHGLASIFEFVPSCCLLRDDCLSNAGFTDVFLSVKVKENADALLLLPALLLELDAVTDSRAR